MDGGSGDVLFGLIFCLLALWFVLWFYLFLPAGMARKRGRSEIGWVLISLIFSPSLAIFLLLILGRSCSAR